MVCEAGLLVSELLLSLLFSFGVLVLGWVVSALNSHHVAGLHSKMSQYMRHLLELVGFTFGFVVSGFGDKEDCGLTKFMSLWQKRRRRVKAMSCPSFVNSPLSNLEMLRPDLPQRT